MQPKLDFMLSLSEVFTKIGDQNKCSRIPNEHITNTSRNEILQKVPTHLEFNRSSAKQFVNETITKYNKFFEIIKNITTKIVSENGDVDIRHYNKEFKRKYESWDPEQITKAHVLTVEGEIKSMKTAKNSFLIRLNGMNANLRQKIRSIRSSTNYLHQLLKNLQKKNEEQVLYDLPLIQRTSATIFPRQGEVMEDFKQMRNIVYEYNRLRCTTWVALLMGEISKV